MSMSTRELGIEGAWEFRPAIYPDDRGSFLEGYRAGHVAEVIGHSFSVAQMNVSVSRRGVVRGIHYADVPPSQAKYVQCLRGAIIDYVIDIRVGSPTFGEWEAVRLDDADRAALYISEGLGHAFTALEDDTTVAYLVSEPFSPGREHGLTPLDAEIGLDLPFGRDELVLSEKDLAAPTLAEALAQGALPSFSDAVEFRRQLADR